MNIDEAKIEAVITNKTKGICVVHYAGVACEMDIIMKLAKKHNLAVVEDAAQAIGAEYKGRKLGAIGDLATFSFHETKNIQSGEGGALVINNSIYAQRAEIIREKGTDRTRFFRGEVEKYTWVDIGSSYLPSELVSAFLFAQLEQIDTINAMRKAAWNEYKKNLSSLGLDKLITIQDIPESHVHNAHMFYILLNNHDMQEKLLQHLKLKGISAVFHYIPLHMSKAGSVYSKVPVPLNVTEDIYNRIIRLPMYPNLDKVQIKYITNEISIFMKNEKLC